MLPNFDRTEMPRALQNMQAAEPLLKNGALVRQLLVGIILDHRGSKHLPKSNRHPLGNARNIANDRHNISIATWPEIGKVPVSTIYNALRQIKIEIHESSR